MAEASWRAVYSGCSGGSKSCRFSTPNVLGSTSEKGGPLCAAVGTADADRDRFSHLISLGAPDTSPCSVMPACCPPPLVGSHKRAPASASILADTIAFKIPAPYIYYIDNSYSRWRRVH